MRTNEKENEEKRERWRRERGEEMRRERGEKNDKSWERIVMSGMEERRKEGREREDGGGYLLYL